MRRYRELVERLRDAVLKGEGRTAPALRQAVAARSAELGGGPAAPPGAEIPAGLRDFVDKTARHAYRITDEEVAALLRGGALGGRDLRDRRQRRGRRPVLARLERGLAALEGGKR